MIVLILSQILRALNMVLNNLRAINFSTSVLCLFLVLFYVRGEITFVDLNSSPVSVFQTIERDDLMVC